MNHMYYVILFLVGFLGALLGGFSLLAGFAVAGAYRYRKEGKAAGPGWQLVRDGLPAYGVSCFILIQNKTEFRQVSGAAYTEFEGWSYSDFLYKLGDKVAAYIPIPPVPEILRVRADPPREGSGVSSKIHGGKHAKHSAAVK